MRTIFPIISWIALAGTIVPALLYLNGSLDLPALKMWMLIATIAWFLTVPLWMERKAG
jgi:hypothetical protein